MTAYLQRRRGRTHIMTYAGSGNWRSLCNYDVRWSWTDGEAGLHFIDRDHDTGPRTKPWCQRCTARVRALADAVLAEDAYGVAQDNMETGP